MKAIEIFQPVDASRDEIWHAISTAQGLSNWQADEVIGSLEDGNFSLRWPALGARMDLSVAEVDEGRRLLLRAGQNALALSVTNAGVLLSHEGLEDDDDIDGFRCSWRIALTVLAHALEKHRGAQRIVEWLFRPISVSRELAHYYFSQSHGLSTWLGTTPGSLVEGGQYALTIGERQISGRVLLSEEGRDLALSVRELELATLVLRTFPASEGRVAGVCVSSWKGDIPKELVDDLRQALDRLEAVLSQRGES